MVGWGHLGLGRRCVCDWGIREVKVVVWGGWVLRCCGASDDACDY